MTRLLTTLAVLSVLLAGGTANAAPITNFSTNAGSATFTPNSPTGFTISNGVVGQAFQGVTPTNDLDGATFSTLNFTVSTVAGATGTGTLTATPPPPGVFDLTAGSGVASFLILNPATFELNQVGSAEFLNLAINFVLLSNTTGIDLGPISQIWSIGVALVNANLATPIVLDSGPPPAINFPTGISPAFTANATGNLFNLNIIPEPTTIAICGLFGVAGLIGARRKLKKSAEPTVAA